MSPLTLILFVVGLGLLIGGAELLVRGASRLALAVGITPLVVGLTVVAFGTSAPELAVSVQSGLAGQSDLAIGNVVGSNIANVLLILGLSALIAPLIVAQQLVRREVPLMIALTALLWLLARDGDIGVVDGALLVGALAIYLIAAIWASPRETPAVRQEYEAEFGYAPPRTPAAILLQIALIAAGLLMLVVGARWLVDGAVTVARTLGVSELVIGLTIVATGTSLPEVATSVIAALRGERDIAVGNVVGSNVFNILSILGIASLVTPGGLDVAPAILRFDLPVALAVAIACLPIFWSGYRIDRWEGALFLGYYVAYIAYLILAATEHDALPEFSAMMLVFVLPLTAITLLILAARAFRDDRRSRAGRPLEPRA
jgi:cation:H+ antiporter